MAVERFQANFRTRNDIPGDNITPQTDVQKDIRAPAGEWKPAPWLPVQFIRNDHTAGDDAFVISKGKVVAMDTQSNLVPAGLRLSMVGAGGGLTYTALDVEWMVEDLVTGEPVAAPVTYTSIQVAQGIMERGLVTVQDSGATLPVGTQGEADDVIEVFISPPVGYAEYDFYVWHLLSDGVTQKFTNYMKQHLVQFWTEGQLKMPHLVATEVDDDDFAVATLNTAGSATAAAGEFVDAGEYWNATNLAQLTRYSLMGVTASSPVVALGLGGAAKVVVAEITDRTPFTVDTAGVLVRKRPSPDLVTKEGDYFLDAEAGVLILHSDTWATGVAATATWTFTYSHYDEAPATAHKQLHFDGPALPGRRVTFDAQSNFVMETVGTTAEQDIVGTVLRVEKWPRGYLEYVKTGFPGATSATAQMPGSATKGFPDQITLSGETVADQLVIINFRK